MVDGKGNVLFVLGNDYHLGDLLWFTAVLASYRIERRPEKVTVAAPAGNLGTILDHNPLIDERIPNTPAAIRAVRRAGPQMIVHDLRPVPIGLAMIRDWRRRAPWRYYRDLWLEARGQWLATFLRLNPREQPRPVLSLTAEDRGNAPRLSRPYVVLAPHTGKYRLAPAAAMWRRIKGWPEPNWIALAEQLRSRGYEPVTLAAAGQTAVPGSTPVLGLPIRQAAAVIEQAEALVSGESGLWFIAAALGTPFMIVPWWLPRNVDWAAPMGVPHALVYREESTVSGVLARLLPLIEHE